VLLGDFFLQTEKEDSRIIQEIRTKHMRGRIMERFVELRIKFVTGHTAQVEMGRLPATKVCLDIVSVSEYIGIREGRV
jgi:hypothetical protein